MSRFIDRTGLRFGKLVVVRRLHNDNVNQAVWLCRCDCGNEKICRASNLHSGTTTTCGCGRRKRPFEWIYNRLISKSNTLRRPCNITYIQFLRFTKIERCSYCNGKIDWQPYPIRKLPHRQAYNLDRVNNDLPYHKDNCVVCCSTCNFMKGNLSRNIFLQQCIKIAKLNEK